MINPMRPQKGKDFSNLPAKTRATFDTTKYLMSTKYDGNQIFIVKQGKAIRFYTSDWKEFTISLVAKELQSLNADFILVGEFMQNCEGKLGDRRKSAILTTYRANFKKGLYNGKIEEGTNILVFDCVLLQGDKLLNDMPAEVRLKTASNLLYQKRYMSVINTELVTGKAAKEKAKLLVSQGWEGTMLIEPDSIYMPDSRVNYAIKLKGRKTADLMCIGIEPGEGKYDGLIGSLILEDSKGRRVSVGSGLNDSKRCKNNGYFIGKVIEIGYEQIMDTYIQPTFIGIRNDKKDLS